jgi:hypothetical protein
VGATPSAGPDRAREQSDFILGGTLLVGQLRLFYLRGRHYTLCETAKLAGVDPHAYLLHALYAAIAKPGAITYPDDLLTPQPA